MRNWILPLVLIFAILLPFNAHAQDDLTLSSLQIQIWPEYDKPGVLVIYDLSISGSTSFPVAVSMRIPISAGNPNAVAVRQADGSLYTMDYTRQLSGEWATIDFTTTTPEVRLEYYDPNLLDEAGARHFEYIWPGDYAVSELNIIVQQPFGATGMRISPSFGTGTLREDNLTYYTQNVGSVSAGQNIRITLDYQKNTDTLSVANQTIQPSAPISQSTTQNLSLSTWLPWVLGVLGAGLIVGGILWFWQTGKVRPAPRNQRRRTRAVAVDGELPAAAGEAAIYCSQCGKRAAAGDQFCRSCGTPIRSK